MCVEDTMAAALDTKVRDAGWYFMWLHSSYSRFGVGRGATSAIGKATTRALNQVKRRFNAAELDLVHVSKYPGFQIARVTIHARQIQEGPFLGPVDEISIPRFPTQ
jgi:hypothetical protein